MARRAWGVAQRSRIVKMVCGDVRRRARIVKMVYGDVTR